MKNEKLIKSLTKHGFSVSYFETAAEAADYLSDSISGETVGFGGSVTCRDMGLYERLGKNNTVYWHWKNPADLKHTPEFTTYLTSVNAIAETGEMVNIDGTGNRIAATLYGPKKLFLICGSQKICPDLHAAIDYARNVAAPKNAQRLNCKTPCAATGKCYDCNSPERICHAMTIYMRPMGSMEHVEVVLIGEEIGY